jgi:hypothetical protein
MTRAHKVLGFLLVAILGIYGCARVPGGGPGGNTAALEAKVQRLEEDFRAAAASRDSFRQQFLAAEDRLGRTQRALEQANATTARERQDRDVLKAERDALQTQYETFRKSIKDLLGQAESALNTPAPTPVVSASSQPTQNTSTTISNIRN